MTIATTAEQATAMGPAASPVAETHARLLAERDQLVAEIERARTGQVEPGDARLAHVWTLAERYARAAGHLAEYNTLARELDGPVQTTTYELRVSVTLDLSVTLTVEADNAEDAMEMVDRDAVWSAVEDREIDDTDLCDWNIAEVDEA